MSQHRNMLHYVPGEEGVTVNNGPGKLHGGLRRGDPKTKKSVLCFEALSGATGIIMLSDHFYTNA